MNRRFLNPFELADFPEAIEDCIEDGAITICNFNRKGTMLAAGCSDGRCLVFDYDTRGLACALFGHRRAITCLSWSISSEYLLTGGRDGTSILWDLKQRQRLKTFQFDLPICSCSFHPTEKWVLVVGLYGNERPCILQRKGVKLDEDFQKVTLGQNSGSNELVLKKRNLSLFALPCFHPGGTEIFVGHSDSSVLIYQYPSLELVRSFKVAVNNAPLRQLEFSSDGKYLLCNTNDRIIRLYRVDTEDRNPEILYRFQDLVERVQYTACGFSGDNEFVVGGSNSNHNLYIWNTNSGALVKILEGPKDSVSSIAWHPKRPLIASVSIFGNIYVWARSLQENWSAFAPHFKELESNSVYVEQEDEFDDYGEERQGLGNSGQRCDTIVDVETLEADQQGGLDMIPITAEDF